MEKDRIVLNDKLHLLQDDINVYVGRKQSVFNKYKDKAGLYIGKVAESETLGTDQYNRNILLDSISPHAIFICGMRGSGKSYTLGVIAEELAAKNSGVGVIIIDPMGIFWSMRNANKVAQEKSFLRKWGMSAKSFKNVSVFLPLGYTKDVPKGTYDHKFTIRPSEISIEEWCLTFGIDRFDTMGLLIERVVDCVKKGYTTFDEAVIPEKGEDYDISDLIDCITLEESIRSKSRGFKQTTRRALIARLNGAIEWGIFSKKGTQLKELSRRGMVSVIDVSFLGDNVRSLVVGILARNILNTRKMVSRHEATGNLKNVFGSIPVTWLMIDEAHILVPSSGQKTAATDSIIEYVRQGRQPGCSLVLATQQPSAIDSRVLSQTDILICHKLVYDDDKKAVFRRMPSEMPSAFKDSHFIKSLPIGMAIIGDKQEQTSRAFLARIRPRISQHEGRECTATLEADSDIVRSNLKELLVERYNVGGEADLPELVASIEEDYNVQLSLDELLNELSVEGRIEREVVEISESKRGKRRKKHIEQEMPATKNDALAEEKLVSETSSICTDEPEERTQPDSNQGQSISLEVVEPIITDDIIMQYLELDQVSQKEDTIRDVDYSKVNIVLEYIGIDEITKLAEKKRKKHRFFGKTDMIICHYLIYYPFWRVIYDYFPKNKRYTSLETYVDGITGELVIKEKTLTRTKGIRDIVNLKKNERDFMLYLISRENPTNEDIQDELGMTHKKVDNLLDSLISKNLVKIKKVGQHSEVHSTIDFNIVDGPNDKRFKNLDLEIKEELIETDALINFIIPESQARKSIEIFSGTKIWCVERIYYPYWVVVYDNGERKRVEIFDALSGSIDNDAKSMLRFRL